MYYRSQVEAGTLLLIDVVGRRLSHYRGDNLVKVYPVAVGKPATPTPTGQYKVVNKILNPGGVLGTRWMGLSIPNGNYGIHGTNNPSSIGTAASLGCVRMHNQDVESLFPQVNIGTSVMIVSRYGGSQTYTPQLGGKNYTVKRGDNLWQIAQRFGVSLDALAQANKLSNPDVLYPGQVLVIP